MCPGLLTSTTPIATAPRKAIHHDTTFAHPTADACGGRVSRELFDAFCGIVGRRGRPIGSHYKIGCDPFLSRAQVL